MKTEIKDQWDHEGVVSETTVSVFLFYPRRSVVGVCGEELQRLVLHVQRHVAQSGDGALVQRALKLWKMQTFCQNADGDGGGGDLEAVDLLSSLLEDGDTVECFGLF